MPQLEVPRRPRPAPHPYGRPAAGRAYPRPYPSGYWRMTFHDAEEDPGRDAFEAFMAASDEPDRPGLVRRAFRAPWRRLCALGRAGSPCTPLAGAQSARGTTLQKTATPEQNEWAGSSRSTARR